MKDINFEKKDYTYLQWSKVRSSSGTAGSFLKATEIKSGKKIYYKLSDFDSVFGIVGHECVNEIIVSRLLNILGVYHLRYNLIYGEIKIDSKRYTTYFCKSESFRKEGERKITFEDYYQIEKKDDETPFDFVKRCGWEEEFAQMLIIDFLILNRDRHGANIEVIMDSKGAVRLAPLFDQGISLLFGCHNEEMIKKFEILEDRPIQSFVGSNSTKENLKLIEEKYLYSIQKLSEGDREYILERLEDILSETHIEKIWEMIWKRWLYYESMFNL